MKTFPSIDNLKNCNNLNNQQPAYGPRKLQRKFRCIGAKNSHYFPAVCKQLSLQFSFLQCWHSRQHLGHGGSQWRRLRGRRRGRNFAGKSQRLRHSRWNQHLNHCLNFSLLSHRKYIYHIICVYTQPLYCMYI